MVENSLEFDILKIHNGLEKVRVVYHKFVYFIWQTKLCKGARVFDKEVVKNGRGYALTCDVIRIACTS